MHTISSGKKVSEDKKSDISTVYAYLAVPEQEVMQSGIVREKKCDMFSCFNGQYDVHRELEFIESIDKNNPTRYTSFHIGWCHCD